MFSQGGCAGRTRRRSRMTLLVGIPQMNMMRVTRMPMPLPLHRLVNQSVSFGRGLLFREARLSRHGIRIRHAMPLLKRMWQLLSQAGQSLMHIMTSAGRGSTIWINSLSVCSVRHTLTTITRVRCVDRLMIYSYAPSLAKEGMVRDALSRFAMTRTALCCMVRGIERRNTPNTATLLPLCKVD